MDEAVAQLLALKEEYKKATGKDFPAPKGARAPSAKKEKQPQPPKKEKLKEKTPEVNKYNKT